MFLSVTDSNVASKCWDEYLQYSLTYITFRLSPGTQCGLFPLRNAPLWTSLVESPDDSPTSLSPCPHPFQEYLPSSSPCPCPLPPISSSSPPSPQEVNSALEESSMQVVQNLPRLVAYAHAFTYVHMHTCICKQVHEHTHTQGSTGRRGSETGGDSPERPDADSQRGYQEGM